ncbi:TORTIFOLIA1-like protein [Vigna angularis]|uniref:TORTIFOLIA1-like protein n=1 Tax=Phaseolus angularis TaxID=3914 RepID=A0A8T0JXS3_PHAAN|nr:TORTIFOLIA1-like protein [Vigna angularis]
MKKGQGGSGGGGGGLELKQRIVCALNKVGDRDTQQIGMEELDRVAQGLRPEGIWSFLSCILETEWEQKASIRKECVRLMGTLATYHDTLLLPHLPKMVASIVKRLRDPDSVVRDVCVNTVALLASKLGLALSHKDKVFLLLVKPIFEALGEQNRHVQSASALCLARIIHNTHHPPLSLLHKMLLRTLKLLKNPHFMAKPALLDLTKTLIQAGGAPTQNILSAAIGSIQDALKHSDWTTRKAASVALAEIALGGASFLGCFRASCVQSLESCRFDKVKPVRDAVLQALKYWTSLPAPDTPDPSETGSSLKENICRGDSDLSSTTESRQKDVRLQKVNMKSTMGRIPLSVKKTCQNYTRNTQHKPDDWHVEVAVPRPHSVVEFQTEESESCSVSKPLETMSADVSSMQDVGYEYVPMDDKQECSSVSNLATDNFETKFLTAHDCFVNSGVPKPIARSQRYSEERSSDEQVYSVKMQHPSSSDSTVTEPSRQTTHECCMQMANEMICIQNQLSDIEIKQANMIHQLQKRTFSRSQPGIHSVDSSDMWKSYKVKAGRKGTEKDVLNSSAKDATRMGLVKNDGIISASRTTNARNGWSENNTNCWKHVKRLVCEGDLNSAYMEALCFNDEFILVELLNTTGPVIVEMSTIHGPNCIAISIEAKEHLLSAIQEAVNLHIFSHSERRRAAELAMKLHHIWGKTAEN